MSLLQLLTMMEPATIVSIQFHPDDKASFCGLKEAQDITVGDAKYFRVKSFYPENYPDISALGITIIVEEVCENE